MEKEHFRISYLPTTILMGFIISIITEIDFDIVFSAFVHARYYKK